MNRARCKFVKENSVPCKSYAVTGSEFCASHDPVIQKEIEERSIEEYKKIAVNHRVQIEKAKVESVLGITNLQHSRRSLQEVIESLEKKKSELEKYVLIAGDICRLEEIYQTAKKTDNAGVMFQVNKSMYYLKRKMPTIPIKAQWGNE